MDEGEETEDDEEKDAKAGIGDDCSFSTAATATLSIPAAPPDTKTTKTMEGSTGVAPPAIESTAPAVAPTVGAGGDAGTEIGAAGTAAADVATTRR